MRAESGHSNESVANTVTANRKVFAFFCIIGIVLIGGGLLSLRVERRIPGAGIVMAEREAYVFAPADGVLAELLVGVGDEVSEGQTLFTVEAGDLDLRILEKSRRLAEARGRLAETEVSLRRAEIKPAEAAVLTAGERLRLLEEIRTIQREIVSAWEELAEERAVRGLEHDRQRVEALRTELDELDSRLFAEWEESGLLGLEKERLEHEAESLRQLVAGMEEELEVLKAQREAMAAKAPISGTVVDIYKRYPGMGLDEGERVLKLAQMDGNYRIKAFVGERNVDLLQPGVPARMESQVFDSMFEGYVLGRIERVVADAVPGEAGEGAADGPRYEVTVTVEESPYPLVLGSSVEVDFLLGRQSLAAILMNRPAEERHDGEVRAP